MGKPDFPHNRSSLLLVKGSGRSIMAEHTPPRFGEPVESSDGKPAARTGVVDYHMCS
jgi:hypothetical protein